MTIEVTIRYCPVCGIATAADMCAGAGAAMGEPREPHELVPTLTSPVGHWEPVEDGPTPVE